MPHSHHSHSGQYCAHAQSALDDVVSRATALGFHSYALTEHVPRAKAAELYPEEVEAGLDPARLRQRFVAYLAHARRLQEEHAQRRTLAILVGAESEHVDGPTARATRRAQDDADTSSSSHLDYFVSLVDSLAPASSSSSRRGPSQVGQGVLDFIVGSVHHVHSVPIDFDLPTFHQAIDKASSHLAPRPHQDHGHAQLMLDYLDAQHEMLRRLRPEVIGHFDLCRLYLPNAPLRPSPTGAQPSELDALLAQVWTRVERNVRFAVSYGALFELNAASFRKGWQTAYPGRDVVDLILALGGRLCLSDDSHGTHQVGLNYHRLKAYLLSLAAPPPPVWYLRRTPSPPEPIHNEDEDEAEEAARREREQAPLSQQPGRSAPIRFARGTEAVCVPPEEWTQWPGWERIERESAPAPEAA